MEKEEIINKIDEGFKQQTENYNNVIEKIGSIEGKLQTAIDRNIKAWERANDKLDVIITKKKTGKRKEYAYFVAVMVLYICLFYIAFSL